MTSFVEHPDDLRALRRNTVRSLIVALLAVVTLGLSLADMLSLQGLYVAKAAGIYGVAAALVLGGVARHRPWRRFGPANHVTLARLVLTALVGGLVFEQGPGVAWAVVAIATLVVALDGVDGWLARRGGMSSPFGAAFDMEVDALLILMLALLAWHLGKAGGWVILAGLMRYGFVAAGYRWAWLKHPLPPSRRRKTGCVLQIFTLILCLVPWLKNPWSDMVAAVGLGYLCYSFGVDIAWLVRHRHSATEEEKL